LNENQTEDQEKGKKFKPHALEHLWKSKGKLTDKAKELEAESALDLTNETQSQ